MHAVGAQVARFLQLSWRSVPVGAGHASSGGDCAGEHSQCASTPPRTRSIATANTRRLHRRRPERCTVMTTASGNSGCIRYRSKRGRSRLPSGKRFSHMASQEAIKKPRLPVEMCGSFSLKQDGLYAAY
ncbi:hypothetical protein MRX96_010026 [Rhipicephalus microplus]